MASLSASRRRDLERWAPPRARGDRFESDFSPPGDYRETLVDGPIALVEDSSVSPHRQPPSGHSEHHQIVLPYLGLFEFKVGSRTALVDANSALYVTGGQDFADRHPAPNVGHASVVITPSEAVLDELCGGGATAAHGAFTAATQPLSPRLALLTHRLLRLRPANGSRLRGEELALAAMRESLAVESLKGPRSRAVDRAKQVLHEHGYEPLSLTDVASAVGVSPVYLTQEFTRCEGIPLYRYQTRLRLARAMIELPSTEDITGLALTLGFSSHSHFSAVFKSMLGITPSQFRVEHS